MSKTANREAAKAYQTELRRKESDERQRQAIAEQVVVIREFRRFLLARRAPDDLVTKLDDWVGELTGYRTYLHGGDSSHPKPPILLPHERK